MWEQVQSLSGCLSTLCKEYFSWWCCWPEGNGKAAQACGCCCHCSLFPYMPKVHCLWTGGHDNKNIMNVMVVAFKKRLGQERTSILLDDLAEGLSSFLTLLKMSIRTYANKTFLGWLRHWLESKPFCVVLFFSFLFKWGVWSLQAASVLFLLVDR